MNHPKDKAHQHPPQLYLGIVDFDSPIYRCAAVHGDNEECGLEAAKLELIQFVQNHIVNPLRCQKYVFVVTGMDNFRHELAVTKPYKGQRSQEKPIHYMPLLEWAIEHFNCLIAEGVEADDYVVNCHQKYQGHSVLVGMDKDNLQSPGWHWNYVKDEGKHITPEEAHWSLAFQMLRGDPGDNIPGIPGLGDAKAARLLNESDLPPMMVAYETYKEKGLLDTYEEQYRLLYMLRDQVIDFESSFVEHKPVLAVEAIDDDEEVEFTGVEVGL